jgi:hypothetical protein
VRAVVLALYFAMTREVIHVLFICREQKESEMQMQIQMQGLLEYSVVCSCEVILFLLPFTMS